MINLPREICIKMKAARRAAGISQSELAAEVGCKQSAISMFESGDGTKLSDETIEKLSHKFGIELRPAKHEEPPVRPASPASAVIGFCPNAHCPTNRAYEVEGRTFHLPNRHAADPVGGKFCALCGEVLEKRCPNCGAPVHDGAICSFCGEPYVV